MSNVQNRGSWFCRQVKLLRQADTWHIQHSQQEERDGRGHLPLRQRDNVGHEAQRKTSYNVSKSFYSTNPGDTTHSGKIQGKANVVGEWTLTANSMLVLYF